MNVFVLCTGRCGSTTFVRACTHITNYSSGHETRSRIVGDMRLAYPEQHIEADNRLAWMLGRLEQTYGNSAFYVHLTRDLDEVVHSFERRLARKIGIINAYREVLMGAEPAKEIDICRDYVKTVTENISLFLRDKSHWMPFSLERAEDDFGRFWTMISADGELNSALREWGVRHNASAA